MEQLRQLIEQAVTSGICRGIVLSRRRAEAEGPQKVRVRPLELARGLVYQFASRHGGRETHENVAPGDVPARVLSLMETTFEHCHLLTAEADYSIAVRLRALTLPTRDFDVRITAGPPSQVAGDTAHDRRKQYLVPEGTPCPFLVEIGVMTPSGQVKKARYAKFRQINRFLELVNDVVPDLPPGNVLNVVDYGCGKSYLTFALHHLLTVVHGRQVRIAGLDRSPPVVETCRRVAERLKLEGLQFQVGEIADQPLEGDLNLAVSLHACDTATDDALAHALE
ncbi:MAG: SAM-dependent methyltransferase, partial [Planctomycetes bacterium]|nr:SAM-dependent methyltransferase [Planctomycetota bacterium]